MAAPVEIAALWWHVNREMRALLHRVGKEYELPAFSFMLLRHIKEAPGITLSELSRQVGAAKSHISTTLETLVKEGYVEKRSDPNDQRVVRLHATEAARRYFAALGDRAQGVWALVLEEYSGSSEEVARFLRELLGALERANARFEREARGGQDGERSAQGGQEAESDARRQPSLERGVRGGHEVEGARRTEDPGGGGQTRETRDAQDVQEPQDARDTQDPQGPQDPRDPRDARETWDARDALEVSRR